MAGLSDPRQPLLTRRPFRAPHHTASAAALTGGGPAMLSPVVAEVRAILGDYVYGVDVSGLPEACFLHLRERGLTLATAESCTGGTVAERITDLPGASAVYRGGVVSYWSSVKADTLGVPQPLLNEYGAVSEPVARAMGPITRPVARNSCFKSFPNI